MKLHDIITITRQRSDWDTDPTTYIQFQPERSIAKTVEHDDGINIDLDINGDIVGIEILG